MPETEAGVNALQITLFSGIIFFILIFALLYFAWDFLRPTKVNITKRSSLLSALDTTDFVNSIEFTTPEGLPAKTYITQGAVHDYMVTMIHLPWQTAAHVVGIPTAQVKTLGKIDTSFEEVNLEGDYHSRFKLFSERGSQIDVRYILDPAAMAITLDLFEHHYWEIYHGTLYISSHTDTPDPDYLDKFIASIRPALELPNADFNND